jgi:hypothetical protein
MKAKKNLSDGVRFVDDVTKRNLELVALMTDCFVNQQV